MQAKLYESKIRQGLEETSRIREEVKNMLTVEPALHNVRSYFVTRGIDRVRVDIILDQLYKDKKLRELYLNASKKRLLVSLLFLLLFACGVAGWFYVWGDWITYFAGFNLILFLFFLQQAASLRGKAAIFE